MIRFPRPLRPGDTVAVTAPSSGVPAALHARLALAIARLRGMGFEVIEGECLRHNHHHVSASADARAEELQRFLLDPSIAAVMPPWGGELALELLSRIDLDRLAGAEPCWFCGFSDLSTLQLPLLLRAGWASVHGPNLMELATPHVVADALWRVLAAPRGEPVVQAASTHHQCDGADWEQLPAAALAPTRATRAQRLDGRSDALQLRGRLLGGCLDTVSRLAGTACGDVPRFVQEHRDHGVVLFLENAELRPCELARALLSLRMHGWFDGVAGVLFGRNAAADAEHAAALSARDAILRALDGLQVPVLLDLDIGHVPPQWSLVQGARAVLDFADGRCAITQTLA